MKTYSFKLLALPIFIALLSGCGMTGGRAPYHAPSETYGDLAGQGTGGPLLASAEYPGYNCPNQSNVEPDYDRDMNGTGFYRVCANKEDTESLLILGQMSTKKTYCVFPAEYVNNQYVFWKPNLTNGLPLSQCITGSEEGLFPKFDGLSSNFNAVFIVDQTARTQMEQCLVLNNYYSCPTYSFGTFR